MNGTHDTTTLDTLVSLPPGVLFVLGWLVLGALTLVWLWWSSRHAPLDTDLWEGGADRERVVDQWVASGHGMDADTARRIYATQVAAGLRR